MDNENIPTSPPLEDGIKASQEAAEALAEAQRQAEAEALAAALKALQEAPAAPVIFPTPTRLLKTTGPTLRDELKAAGLQDVPVSITPDAVEVDPSVDPATLVAVKAVVEAHDATKALVIHAISCTPAQGEIALYQTGHYEAYQAAVANSAYVPLKIYVQKATMWELSNPYIQAMQAELGLSDDQVQALFDLAATL